MAKARLGPLTHIGETVRNELSGATMSSRITNWIQRHSGLQFKNTHHFLDSRIVRDMLDKDSYGFTTFFGLRVAEIQQKTTVDNWKHIPSAQNIADLLTKGCTPAELSPNSEWQTGPAFLTSLDESEWPVSPRPSNDLQVVQDTLEPFFRKSKVLVAKSIYIQSSDSLDQLVMRCSSLDKLLRIVAYILRFFRIRFPPLCRDQRTGGEFTVKKQLTSGSDNPISVSERNDAWISLIAWDQRARLQKTSAEKLVPKEIVINLSNLSYSVSYLVVGSRMKNFPLAFTGHDNDLPIIPYSNLAKLIVQYYHDKYHVEVDTIVSHVRQDCWVMKCRKIASNIDSKCKICKIKRKNVTSQIMGDLPDFRIQMIPAFTTVGCDLFGPLLIKDEVVRRGPKVTKKV